MCELMDIIPAGAARVGDYGAWPAVGAGGERGVGSVRQKILAKRSKYEAAGVERREPPSLPHLSGPVNRRSVSKG